MADFILREDITKAQETPRITLPYFSKYEYTALLSVRAQQLADGAPPMVPMQEFNRDDPRLIWKVAEREILERKLPFILRRHLPDGSSEYWSIAELELAW
jgi:DNA-directed RNA polymerase I, II, and III subunit RPABC2